MMGFRSSDCHNLIRHIFKAFFLGNGFRAVHVGHHEIQQDHIGASPRQGRRGGYPRRARADDADVTANE